MRARIILVGFGIILFGLVLWIGIGFPIELTGTIGIINIIIGIAIPKSTGLELQPEQMGTQMGAIKLVVDQARAKSSIYELFFTDNKLVMKRLASTTTITVVALLFFFIGGIAGGLTGYSLQEFLSQRSRDRDKEREQYADPHRQRHGDTLRQHEPTRMEPERPKNRHWRTNHAHCNGQEISTDDFWTTSGDYSGP